LRVRTGLRDDGGLAAAGRAEHEDDGLRGERAARKPRARRGDGGKGIVTTGRGGSVDRLVDRTQEPEQEPAAMRPSTTRPTRSATRSPSVSVSTPPRSQARSTNTRSTARAAYQRVDLLRAIGR
jgi:hypothetical protein